MFNLQQVKKGSIIFWKKKKKKKNAGVRVEMN